MAPSVIKLRPPPFDGPQSSMSSDSLMSGPSSEFNERHQLPRSESHSYPHETTLRRDSFLMPRDYNSPNNLTYGDGTCDDFVSYSSAYYGAPPSICHGTYSTAYSGSPIQQREDWSCKMENYPARDSKGKRGKVGEGLVPPLRSSHLTVFDLPTSLPPPNLFQKRRDTPKQFPLPDMVSLISSFWVCERRPTLEFCIGPDGRPLSCRLNI
jgi:hypothetical protein